MRMNTLGTKDSGQSRLDALLGRVERSLADDLLPVDIFNDEEIFRAEMERIFLKSWVFLGHESELANKGDFVVRRIGVDAVIVTRDQSGALNVLSNHCRHRGTEICRTDRGNAHHFTCPYHGWMYKCNGDWAGAPTSDSRVSEPPDVGDPGVSFKENHDLRPMIYGIRAPEYLRCQIVACNSAS
jgi:N,N-dimethyl phenylurea N-demethylase alpha subunit